MLVTGGAGFIGSNFIRFWSGRHPEDHITNLDRLTYAGNLENLVEVEGRTSYKFVHGDICDGKLIEELFQAEGFDCVVHFAAESHVDRSILGPEVFIHTNVQGTFTLLEAARRWWFPPERRQKGRSGRLPGHPASVPKGFCFLQVSTDEVFGSLTAGDGAATEASPYAPNSPYAASKAAADHLVRSYQRTYGVPAVITNCSNNFGPYQFPEKLIPLVIHKAIHGEPIPVYGEGKNVRDWIYVDDHCLALETVLDRGLVGERYNVGGGNQWQNIDVVHMICDRLDEKLGSAAPPRRSLIQFVDDRPGHDLRYAMDISKISRELHWRPQKTLETGLSSTIDWYLEHSDWVQRITTGDYQNYFQKQYGSRLSPR